MSDVTISGPLFSGGAPEVITMALEDMVREVTELGVERLTTSFPTGVPVKTGNYRRNINPTIAGMTGRIDDSQVIYGPWIEGTGSRNQTTRFKGYSTFRRTAQWLEEQVPIVARKRAEMLVKELGG